MHNEKSDVGTGGNNGRGRPLVGRAKKGVGFSREHPRCKGWSAREHSSIDVACVLRKREREKRIERQLEERASDDLGKEAKRERERERKLEKKEE